MAATERGAASLLVVALIGVVLLLGMAANLVIAAAAAHRSAQAAADLAALAGAQARQQADVTTPCEVARTVAAENNAGLTECRLDGEDVLVVVQVESPHMFGQEFEIVGRARAGPEHAGFDGLDQGKR